LKEIGDVGNWAEMLDRDLAVLEETMRIVDEEGGGRDILDDEEYEDENAEDDGEGQGGHESREHQRATDTAGADTNEEEVKKRKKKKKKMQKEKEIPKPSKGWFSGWFLSSSKPA